MSPQFSFASLFQNITAYVATGWCDDDACGYIFINRFGKKINANIYDNVYGFQEGYFLVQRDNHYGYVDDSAREIIPCSFHFKIF